MTMILVMMCMRLQGEIKSVVLTKSISEKEYSIILSTAWTGELKELQRVGNKVYYSYDAWCFGPIVPKKDSSSLIEMKKRDGWKELE